MDNYFLITDNKCFSTTKLFLLPIDTKNSPIVQKAIGELKIELLNHYSG